ncbi:MAG: division/cell wall cluster transcriptional repressor MraZ [Acidobacteriota bacterium]|nr:MAG: division/cell wall cluster transcriptional repressor MraZ [Acidobacteriota bacterium]
MLRGHATARVDSKGRLKIPAEFLDSFLSLCEEQHRVYITSRDAKMVLVYPLPVWRRQEKRLSTLTTTDPDLELYRLAVSYWGRESSVDRQGRILIHPRLREATSLDGVVSVFGKQHTLELCDHRLLRDSPPVLTPEKLAALTRFGI